MNRGIRVVGRSGFSIERAAAIVRRLMLPTLPFSKPVNGLELFEFGIEELGKVLTRGSAVITAVQELPAAIEGYTQFDAAEDRFCVTLSERSYKHLENEESRPHFTLCHEIGHLALHSATLRHLGQLPHREVMLERSKDKHRPFEDSEWQANRFASAFLMPAPGLERMRAEGRLDDDEVVRAYHTSYEAAQYRISEFEAKGDALVRAWQKG